MTEPGFDIFLANNCIIIIVSKVGVKKIITNKTNKQIPFYLIFLANN